MSGAKASGDWLRATEGEAGAGAAPCGARCSSVNTLRASVNTLRRDGHLGDPRAVLKAEP